MKVSIETSKGWLKEKYITLQKFPYFQIQNFVEQKGTMFYEMYNSLAQFFTMVYKLIRTSLFNLGTLSSPSYLTYTKYYRYVRPSKQAVNLIHHFSATQNTRTFFFS